MTGEVNSQIEKGDVVVVYDLPSENRTEVGHKQIELKIKNLRIASIRKLHKLGLLCTESVVIVPRNKLEELRKVIEEINRDYEEVSNDEGLENFKPTIKVIELAKDQAEEFKDIAERKLLRKLDEAIDRISDLMAEIDEITEEAKLKKLKSNVKRAMRELEHIEELAKELGIKTNGKVDLLYSLYDKALEKIKEVIE